jgi:glycosyltransferase involved in cell wall biosynthesis
MVKLSLNPRERVSIAMATYNGAPYLREQVESLFTQTHLPDELVVQDDCSTDGTLALLRELAACAPFKMWVLESDHNRGVNASFQSAILRCSGDVVFFCDQDDIWLPRKIERCLAALSESPGAGYVFCDALQFSSGTGDLGKSMWQVARFSAARRLAFRRNPLKAMLTGGNFVYGMASAFRREILQRFQPIDCDAAGMTHDTWFAMHAAALGIKGVALKERLVRYRRHRQQASLVLGGGAASGQARLLKAQSQKVALITALGKVRCNIQRDVWFTDGDEDSALDQLDRKIAFLEARERLRQDRSLLGALQAIVNPDYWLLASGPASVFRDFRGM